MLSFSVSCTLFTMFLLRLLQTILLSDDTTDSDTDSDDSDFSLSRDELQDMLRLHRFTRQHQSKFHSDREVGEAHINTASGDIRNSICNVIFTFIFLFSSASPIPVLQHWTPLNS